MTSPHDDTPIDGTSRRLDRRLLLRSAVAASSAFGAPALLRADALAHPLSITHRRSPRYQAADLSGYTSAKVDWQMAQGDELILGALDHPWMTAIEPLLPQFTELTGITVTPQVSAEAEYIAKMPTTLAGGSSTPDVFMIWAMGQAVEAGWLMPLDDLYGDATLTDAGWYDEADIFTSAKQFPIWPADGVRYAVAITAESQTLFLRKDLLDAAGLPAPATLDELYAAAVALKTGDVAGAAFRAKPTAGAVAWPAAGFIFSYGGQIIDEAGTAVFDSPEAIAGVEMYAKILKDAGPAGVASYDWPEALGDYSAGKAAIACDSSNFTADIEDPDKSQVVGKTMYGAFPSDGAHPAKPNMWHWLFGMNKNTEHANAAWLFITWATSKPTSLLLARNRAAVTRTSAWTDPEFRTLWGEQAAEAALANLQAADGAVMTRAWFNPKFPQVGDLMAIAINQTITGDKDAATALTEAAAKANEVLGG